MKPFEYAAKIPAQPIGALIPQGLTMTEFLLFEDLALEAGYLSAGHCLGALVSLAISTHLSARVSQMFELKPIITSADVVIRAKELDHELRLEPGHGIAQVTLEAMLGDIAAGDFERILCGWSFKEGEAWAESVLNRLRRQWAAQDAQRPASPPPAPA